ncbi:MAG TPA: VOC family protein [Acetobacteraceae bacterium]|nr:VOC family protein [Acetobacteraceae bacterium]
MTPFNLTFHHLGLAVRRPNEALSFLQGLGYRCAEPVFDGLQNVHLIMCAHQAMPAVEIIYPGAGTTPIDGYLARQPNGLVYHACYGSPDLAESLAQWEAAGIAAVCVSEPKPAILFGGRKVSFYNVLGVGLIEIIETEAGPATALMSA